MGTAPMRPAMAKLLEHNGKTYWLPIPARYRELVEAVRVLGIKDEADEDDMQTVEYRSLIGVLPVKYNTWREIDSIAECLSMLTPGQLEAVKMMCAEFGISFGDIGNFFEFIAGIKLTTMQEIKEKGIPVLSDEGGA